MKKLIGLSVTVVMMASLSNAFIEYKDLSGDGRWTNAANWVGGVVPAALDDVRILNGSTACLDVNYSVNSLMVGRTTDGYLVVTNGAALSVANNATVAVRANKGGLDIYDGSSVTSVNLTVGGRSTSESGYLYIHSGGTFSAGGVLSLGAIPDASENFHITIDGGILSADSLAIGSLSTITLSGENAVLELTGGDFESELNTLKLGGQLIGATSIFYDGSKTIATIPEPSTFGLLTSFGASLLFIIRKLAI
jgi:hypothetical protein